MILVGNLHRSNKDIPRVTCVLNYRGRVCVDTSSSVSLVRTRRANAAWGGKVNTTSEQCYKFSLKVLVKVRGEGWWLVSAGAVAISTA